MQRLDEEWTAGRVVTLDVMDAPDSKYGDSVGFEVTPTFILYDAAGSEVRRWVGRTPTMGELPRRSAVTTTIANRVCSKWVERSDSRRRLSLSKASLSKA